MLAHLMVLVTPSSKGGETPTRPGGLLKEGRRGGEAHGGVGTCGFRAQTWPQQAQIA